MPTFDSFFPRTYNQSERTTAEAGGTGWGRALGPRPPSSSNPCPAIHDATDDSKRDGPGPRPVRFPQPRFTPSADPANGSSSPAPSTARPSPASRTRPSEPSSRRQARKIVYHFQEGDPSLYGECANLADFILETTKGQASTHAYIDKPLKGFAVLPALACRFVYLGPEGALGFSRKPLRRAGTVEPVEGQQVSRHRRATRPPGSACLMCSIRI